MSLVAVGGHALRVRTDLEAVVHESPDDAAKGNVDDQLFNDGMPSKPRPAETVTFDEFVAAQELFTELMQIR